MWDGFTEYSRPDNFSGSVKCFGIVIYGFFAEGGVTCPRISEDFLKDELILSTIVLNMSSEIHPNPVSAALFPKVRQAVLGLLFGHPDRAYYLREIVELTTLGVGHVQRELHRLTQGCILRRSKQGRHVYFQANDECPVYEELRRLVTKTTGAAGLLRAALDPLRERIVAAFIYGSVARTEEGPESDVDVMIVGGVSFAEAVEAVRAVESRIGRAINPTVYPPVEWKAKIAEGHHFLTSVQKREKLFVVGNEDELRRLPG